jgi:hypothetical protein
LIPSDPYCAPRINVNDNHVNVNGPSVKACGCMLLRQGGRRQVVA